MLEPHVQLVRTRLVLRLLYRAVQDNTIKQIEAFTSCVCNKCVFVLVPTSCQLPCRVWKLPIHSLGTSLLKWYPMQSMCRWAAFNGGINLQSAPVKGFIKRELCWKASSFSWQEGFVALHSPGHLFAIYTIIPRIVQCHWKQMADRQQIWHPRGTYSLKICKEPLSYLQLSAAMCSEACAF